MKFNKRSVEIQWRICSSLSKASNGSLGGLYYESIMNGIVRGGVICAQRISISDLWMSSLMSNLRVSRQNNVIPPLWRFLSSHWNSYPWRGCLMGGHLFWFHLGRENGCPFLSARAGSHRDSYQLLTFIEEITMPFLEPSLPVQLKVCLKMQCHTYITRTRIKFLT